MGEIDEADPTINVYR